MPLVGLWEEDFLHKREDRLQQKYKNFNINYQHLNVEPRLKINCIKRRKQQFDYDTKENVSGTQNPKLYFKYNIFNNTLDQAISSKSVRFEKNKRI